ncbi:MAG: hypothetical protein K1X91_12550 [Bacteriodetes bacterium]|nr:hypothetical protein [Bacteroidota bacterium]
MKNLQTDFTNRKKHRMYNYIILALFAIYFISTEKCFGADDLPVIQFIHGEISLDYIPFDKKFYLTGSTKFSEVDSADYIFMLVESGTKLESSDTSICQLPFNQYQKKLKLVWTRTIPDEKNFKFIVNPREHRLTSLGKPYTIKLIFASKANAVETKIFSEFQKLFSEKLKSSDSNKELITTNNTTDLIKQAVRNISKSKCPYYITIGCGGCGVLRNSTTEASNENSIAQSFMNYLKIIEKSAVIKMLIDNDSFEKNIKSYLKDIKDKKEIISSLVNGLKTMDKQELKSNGLDTNDISHLVSGQEKGINDTLFNKFKDKFNDNKRINKDTLNWFLTILLNLGNEYKSKGKLLTEQKENGESINIILSKIANSNVIQNTITVFEVSTINSYVWGTKTELDKIRIGTAFGIASIPIQANNNDVEWNMAWFAGVKYYFGAVDYSSPTIYKSDINDDGSDNYGGLSHAAITFGFTFNTTLSYQSQTLSPVLSNNIYPLIGLSYEPCPWIVLNVGTIFLKQPHSNLLVNKATLRTVPYIGLSWDFDILNKLKELIPRLL